MRDLGLRKAKRAATIMPAASATQSHFHNLAWASIREVTLRCPSLYRRHDPAAPGLSDRLDGAIAGGASCVRPHESRTRSARHYGAGGGTPTWTPCARSTRQSLHWPLSGRNIGQTNSVERRSACVCCPVLGKGGGICVAGHRHPTQSRCSRMSDQP